jgi:hypothetical protein
MWLPNSIYERIPQAMLVLGLLFMFSAAYIGFHHPWTKLYFGTGVICFLWSLWVVTLRLRHRKPQQQDTQGTESESLADSAAGTESAAREAGAGSS